MKYIDFKDWASANREAVKEIGARSRDEFTVKLIEAYNIAGVQDRARMLNNFQDVFITLFDQYNDEQDTLIDNDPTSEDQNLSVAGQEDVKMEENTEGEAEEEIIEDEIREEEENEKTNEE